MRVPDLAVTTIWMASASAVTALAWYVDKRAATHGQRRIPERRLLLLVALGGWPAALLMTRLLRHKTRKQPFGALLWLCALLNAAAVATLVWRD